MLKLLNKLTPSRTKLLGVFAFATFAGVTFALVSCNKENIPESPAGATYPHVPKEAFVVEARTLINEGSPGSRYITKVRHVLTGDLYIVCWSGSGHMAITPAITQPSNKSSP